MAGQRFELRLEPLSEHQEQCDLMSRILDNIVLYPEFACVFAVPNGGWRTPKTAGLLQQEGVKPGVPDLIFPYARGGCFGYYQEQKKTRNSSVSIPQRAWHRWLRAQGYLVDVCKGCEAGWQSLLAYRALPPTIDTTTIVLVPGIEVATDVETLQMLHDLLPEWAALARARLKTRIEGAKRRG